MAKPITSLIGRTFGRLEVLSFAGHTGHRAIWNCLCRCGESATVTGEYLRSSPEPSCGCYGREQSAENCRKNFTSHGMTRTRVYRSWISMLDRCTNKNDPAYPRYGGRGIKICKAWLSFESFFADMGLPPSDKHSLDRYPDNDGNYEPGNCRWATPREQALNRRTNHHVTFRGETKPLGVWAKEVGIDQQILYGRITRRRWSVERALTQPVR